MNTDFLAGLSVGILIGLLASCGAVIAEYRRRMHPTIHLFFQKDNEFPISEAEDNQP
jgi:hypothetical protein